MMPPGSRASLVVSLPKSRFERADDVARQGSDAQQRLRTAQSGVCRAHPSRAKHAFASRYNRWHISQGFGEGDPRRTRSNDQHIRSARASGTRWAGPGCPWLAPEPAGGGNPARAYRLETIFVAFSEARRAMGIPSRIATVYDATRNCTPWVRSLAH